MPEHTPKLKLLLVLALLDIITTLWLVGSGRAYEGNLFMHPLLAKPVEFTLVKLCITSGLCIYLGYRAKGHPRGERTINIITIIMSCVVGWNTFWLIFAPHG